MVRVTKSNKSRPSPVMSISNSNCASIVCTRTGISFLNFDKLFSFRNIFAAQVVSFAKMCTAK